MKDSLSLLGGVMAAGMCLGGVAQAQIVAGHYPAGAEGIKAGSLPPPGLYLRDYSFYYSADTYKDGPPSFDISAFINAPRVIWMTDKKVLGASYGMDVIVPFGYMDWEVMGSHGHHFGLGDISVEPLLLSWNLGQFDLAAGYAFWAPLSGAWGEDSYRELRDMRERDAEIENEREQLRSKVAEPTTPYPA